MSNQKNYEKELAFQADRRRASVEFIKIVSDLWYDKAIELVFFRNQLIDSNVSDIINLHEYAAEFVQKPISIFDTVEIAQAIKSLDLPPAKLDIGKLTYEYHLEDTKYNDSKAFVIDKLKDAKKTDDLQPKDVVLYGFGRIGRLLARELMLKTGRGNHCLLYTSDAADEGLGVDLGGRRIIKKIFFKQKTAYEISLGLVGSEMCIRDRYNIRNKQCPGY